VLRSRVAALDPVVTMFGWSAENVRLEDGSAQVTAVSDSGETCEIRADFVVGCDGVHSVVREQVGITCSADDLGQRMVLAVFGSKT
jgi:2-polyprenyl-6-methoxyphenol hydroxylase-like FAD-dependent oxidoreductase